MSNFKKTRARRNPKHPGLSSDRWRGNSKKRLRPKEQGANVQERVRKPSKRKNTNQQIRSLKQRLEHERGRYERFKDNWGQTDFGRMILQELRERIEKLEGQLKEFGE